ncbi:MAG: histidinol dehydrogenase [Candidatus Bathyarchaeia archaeon]
MNKNLALKIFKVDSLPPEWRKRNFSESDSLEKQVEAIIEKIKEKGDEALINFTEKFDKVQINREKISVNSKEIEEAYKKVSYEQLSALKSMKEKIENAEKTLLEKISNIEINQNGIHIKIITKPIESVGCYVPGGRAAYPSTLVMAATPARLAGVPRIVVCSPPRADSSLNPLTLVAADICEVDEFYRVGGAQAIAALAYGTETIKPVLKIVGPGNKYVTVAKRLVSKVVAVDMPAGPSELLILADETANQRLIALDMSAQAEHGSDSIVGLITTSEKIADEVIKELERITSSAPRRDMLTQALANNGFIVLCKSNEDMIKLANDIAPEHVEILTENPEELAGKISTAGLVLLGPYTPASLSDYLAGTNHILPTGGFGKVFSGLSVLDFMKRFALLECSIEGLIKTADPIRVLAEAEGLPNHYLAVKGRFEK